MSPANEAWLENVAWSENAANEANPVRSANPVLLAPSGREANRAWSAPWASPGIRDRLALPAFLDLPDPLDLPGRQANLDLPGREEIPVPRDLSDPLARRGRRPTSSIACERAGVRCGRAPPHPRHDGMDWRRRIDALLAGSGPHMVFQPIHRLSDGVRVGWEALARFPEDRLPAGSAEAGLTDEAGLGFSPDVWFAAADLEGLGVDLEVAAITAALERLDDVPAGDYMAVNTGPETLVSGELAAAVERWDLSNVVVELTEHLAIADYPAVKAAVRALQSQHSANLCTKIPWFAADDMGAGAASLRHLAELGELLTFCKLDVSLTAGIDTDRSRRALAAALVGMGHELGFRVVAEGVEHEAQLIVLKALGAYAAQGWLFGKPGPLP